MSTKLYYTNVQLENIENKNKADIGLGHNINSL